MPVDINKIHIGDVIQWSSSEKTVLKIDYWRSIVKIGEAHWVDICDVELIKTPAFVTLKNLAPGDEVIDEDDNWRTVLAIQGDGLYALSDGYDEDDEDPDDAKNYGFSYTAHEMEDCGWEVVRSKTPSKASSVTIQEIAAWKGVDPSTIVIEGWSNNVPF